MNEWELLIRERVFRNRVTGERRKRLGPYWWEDRV